MSKLGFSFHYLPPINMALLKRGRSSALPNKDPARKKQRTNPPFTPDSIGDLLGHSSAETRRTLPSASCISNVLSIESQGSLQQNLSRVLTPGTLCKRNNVSSRPDQAVQPTRRKSIAISPENYQRLEGVVAEVPVELWSQIFLYLSDGDKWNLAQTSKRYYEIFRHHVGYEYLVLFQSSLTPLHGLRDPTVGSNIIRTESFSIQCLENLRIVRRAHEERFVLHWRGSLTCLVLYHPTKPSSPESQRVWMQYFQNNGITVGDEHYITNQIPPWIETGKQVLAVVPLNESNEFLLRYVRHELHKPSEFLRFSFVFHPQGDIRCQLRVFSRNVNRVVQYDEELPSPVRVCLLEMLQEEIRQKGIYLNWDNATTGLIEATPPSAQPARISRPLYDYQLRGLKWMMQIEHNIHERWYPFQTLVRAPGFPALNFYLRTAPYEEPFSNPNSFQVVKDRELDTQGDSFSTRGGIFADEMGLGKTMVVLSLLSTSPRPLDKEKQQFLPLGRSAALFETKASLVVCPSHIMCHWKQEIENNAPFLKVVEISVMCQIRSLSYQDILDADVVIISHQFLKNKNYLKRIGKLSTIHKRSLRNHDKFSVTTRNPILQHFGWHRIILDEGHEIMSKGVTRVDSFSPFEACGKEIFDSFLSNYRWYISGTPLPHGRASLVGALYFLQFKLRSGHELIPRLAVNEMITSYEFAFFDIIKQTLFWRNTKQTTADQVSIPQITEEIKLLTLSPIEQAMYEAATIAGNEALMRQICTLPTHSATDINYSLTEIKSRMNCQYSRELGESWEQLLKHQEILNGLEKDLISNLRFMMSLEPHGEQYQQTADRIGRRKVSMETVKNLIGKWEGKIVRLISQTACFTRLSATGTNQCAFCNQNLPSVSVKALCHHSFCVGCFDRTLSQSGRCPACAVRVTLATSNYVSAVEETALVSSPVQSRPAILGANSSFYDSLVNSFGTKIASILCYVKKLLQSNPKEKIIVFSKWDSLLQVLVHALHSDGITGAVICQGTVNSRRRALNSFLDTSPDSPNLILLSLNHAASGAHLTVATHIILVDPVTGTKEEAYATDAQALARAHRLGQNQPLTAVRFIVHSTIDQRDYENVHGCLRNVHND